MANTRIVKEVLKLIDQKDPKRNIGHVSTGLPRSFNYKPRNASSNPDNPTFIDAKNIIWKKTAYEHDFGKYRKYEYLDQFFSTGNIPRTETDITSANGNFNDSQFPANYSACYKAIVKVAKNSSVPITIRAERCSVAVFHLKPGIGTELVYNSGENSHFPSPTSVVLHLTADSNEGTNAIYIMYYRQVSGGSIEITGDLGNFISSFENKSFSIKDKEPQVANSTSKFLDGATGPSLVNIVEVNRMTFNESLPQDEDITKYILLRENISQLSYNTVSGWGDNDFVVTSNKIPDFPIAGTCIFNDPDPTRFVISGVRYHKPINQTIVGLSGTLSVSPMTNLPIYIANMLKISEMNYSRNSIVSGVDRDVIAGKSYSYYVMAVTDSGSESRLAGPIAITAGDFTAPGAVTGLSATGANKSIILEWTNPSDEDIKGIHIWDQDNPDSSVRPIQTLLKGSNATIPTKTIVTQTTSGQLIDDWSYTLYISVTDWAGNEDTTSMPSASATTTVEIKTKRTGQRIETDTATNQLRFYNANNDLTVRIGEDVSGTTDGIAVTTGVIKVNTTIDNSYLEIWSNKITFTDTEAQDVIHIDHEFDGNANSSGIQIVNVDGSGNNYSVDRIGVKSVISIANSQPNTRAIALYGQALQTAGSNNAYAGYFADGDVKVENNIDLDGNLDVGGDVLIGTAGYLDASTSTRLDIHGTDRITFWVDNDPGGDDRALILQPQRVEIGTGSNQWAVKFNCSGIGFFGSEPLSKQTITGSAGGNAALANLLAALESMGLIVDSSS